MTSELTEKHCVPCEGGIPPLEPERTQELLGRVTNWQLSEDGKEIHRDLHFKNYYETMAFVNAVAFMAHREDHHPDLEVSYNKCRVRYSTHAIDGLSENDFVCAAKVDRIIA